jgi:hypothetical protein
MSRLSTELAIFRAFAASAVYYAAKVNTVAAKVAAYLVSTAAKLLNICCDEVSKLFTAFNSSSADYLIGKLYHIHFVPPSEF